MVQMLNEIKNEILCVRGNCEAEVDQMVLDFPVMAEYIIMYIDSAMLFVTHGHKFNTSNLPPLKNGDILIHGHTHIQAIDEHGYYTYINPGSVAIPKNGNTNSYMTYENGIFVIKDFYGKEIMKYNAKSR